MKTVPLYAPAFVLIVWATVLAVTGTVMSPLFLALLTVAVVLEARELARRYGNR